MYYATFILEPNETSHALRWEKNEALANLTDNGVLTATITFPEKEMKIPKSGQLFLVWCPSVVVVFFAVANNSITREEPAQDVAI